MTTQASRQAAGYIATDTGARAIYGIGTSEAAAVAEARTESNDPTSEYVTIPATQRLLDAVRENGGGPGDMRWAAWSDSSDEPIGWGTEGPNGRCVADLDEDRS